MVRRPFLEKISVKSIKKVVKKQPSPNRSADRRIGLNVQYIATHVSQTKHNYDSAILVRGKDQYQNFDIDIPASIDLDTKAIARQLELEKLYRETAGQDSKGS